MLKEPLFKTLSLRQTENTIEAELEIDQFNEIFAGHFPDQPVVPGACMLQIVKESLAKALNKSLRLTLADNIKFLSLIEPAVKLVQLNIAYTLSDNQIKVNATLFAAETTFMKLQAAFVEA